MLACSMLPTYNEAVEKSAAQAKSKGTRGQSHHAEGRRHVTPGAAASSDYYADGNPNENDE